VILLRLSQVEMIDPAVRGTLNVLQSCKKSGTVKRVVITSSSAAVRFRADVEPEQLLDESSWSDLDICEQFQVGKEGKQIDSTCPS
jgi:nucleoside-diphosphate-sugar epimerase